MYVALESKSLKSFLQNLRQIYFGSTYINGREEFFFINQHFLSNDFCCLIVGASDLLTYRPNVSHAFNNLVRSSEMVTFSFEMCSQFVRNFCDCKFVFPIIVFSFVEYGFCHN